MLNTPDKVQALIDEMAAPHARRRSATMRRSWRCCSNSSPARPGSKPWDNGYLSRLVQKQFYGYDRQEARKYFAYDNVRDGILKLTEDLFGVDIRPWNTPVWDPAVETYEMYDRTS